MNANIKKLIGQSFTDEQGEQFDIAKFAELIISECIGRVQKRYMGDQNREDAEVLRCVADLKQHFGIKQ